MKARSLRLAVTTLLVALACLSAQAEDYNEEIRKADIVLSIKDSNSFDIGIGRIENGKRQPVFFPKEFLRGFLRRERQKDLILVCRQKHGLVNDSLRDMLKSLGFKRIVTCDMKADDIYATRRRIKRSTAEIDKMSAYRGHRELECVTTADQLTMNIGMEVKSPVRDELTQVVSDSMFTRGELLPFLQQDVQRCNLVITLPKNFSAVQEAELTSFAQKSNFPNYRIERSRGMFRDMPVRLIP